MLKTNFIVQSMFPRLILFLVGSSVLIGLPNCCCESHQSVELVETNKTLTPILHFDYKYAENALNLIVDFKEQIRQQLLNVYNRSQTSLNVELNQQSVNRSFSHDTNSNKSSCFDQIRLSLQSTLNTTRFEWLLQSM